MALTSAFFDAQLVGGEYDRIYSAEHFAEYFASFIGNGVFADPATSFQVISNIPSDMTVLVKAGKAWIQGYYCNNDNNMTLNVDPADGSLDRVDAIVLRWSKADRAITLAVKTGTAMASPTAPTLERSADNYEIMLATVDVVAGATAISQTAIADKRADSSVCGWVTGTVNQIDTTDLFIQYDDAFQTWFANIQAQLSGDVAANLQGQIDSLAEYKPKPTAITLPVSGWSKGTQTIVVNGVSAVETEQEIRIIPSADSQSAYLDAMVKCTGQGYNSLTFTTEDTPVTDLTVYVIIQKLN